MNKWMAHATWEEKEELARRAHVSVNTLYRLAKGDRYASPDVARRLFAATLEMWKETKNRLPLISVEELLNPRYFV